MLQCIYAIYIAMPAEGYEHDGAKQNRGRVESLRGEKADGQLYDMELAVLLLPLCEYRIDCCATVMELQNAQGCGFNLGMSRSGATTAVCRWRGYVIAAIVAVCFLHSATVVP